DALADWQDCASPPCLADTNGDGVLAPNDFNAWILAFNTQSPACDQNGDGLCNPADFNTWVFNFNTGC
ncbi:MAG: GC-type dockerin domain-anchored protein, partial [Planctomycetota bacterium]